MMCISKTLSMGKVLQKKGFQALLQLLTKLLDEPFMYYHEAQLSLNEETFCCMVIATKLCLPVYFLLFSVMTLWITGGVMWGTPNPPPCSAVPGWEVDMSRNRNS